MHESFTHMIAQKPYRESVSPDPAVESGLLAMVDGVYIVLEHAIANKGCDSKKRLFRTAATAKTRLV